MTAPDGRTEELGLEQAAALEAEARAEQQWQDGHWMEAFCSWAEAEAARDRVAQLEARP